MARKTFAVIAASLYAMVAFAFDDEVRSNHDCDSRASTTHPLPLVRTITTQSVEA